MLYPNAGDTRAEMAQGAPAFKLLMVLYYSSLWNPPVLRMKACLTCSHLMWGGALEIEEEKEAPHIHLAIGQKDKS